MNTRIEPRLTIAAFVILGTQMRMITVRDYSRLRSYADLFMLPIMYFLQGNVHETPQRTHVWNRRHLCTSELLSIQKPMTVLAHDVSANPVAWFGFIPLFHMPIFGGWKKFVVLKPVDHPTSWYVGWKIDDTAQLSLLPLSGSVRVLLQQKQACFFGVDSQGMQIPLQMTGIGEIGSAGVYSQIPLL